MPRRFIDQFDVLLLDLADTFTFNVDRFSHIDGFKRRISGSGEDLHLLRLRGRMASGIGGCFDI
jgi:hypothetical protein